jgi:His-Xaa-Ser repeat protein HxsA
MKRLIITALATVAVAGFGTSAEARDWCGGHSYHHGGHHHGGYYGGHYGGHYGGCSSFGISLGLPLFYSRPYYSQPYYSSYPRYYSTYPRYYSSGYAYRYSTYPGARVSSSALDVQDALARRGYYDGQIDGVIGPQSRNAIRRYQYDYGLPVTGIIDYPLLRSLGI